MSDFKDRTIDETDITGLLWEGSGERRIHFDEGTANPYAIFKPITNETGETYTSVIKISGVEEGHKVDKLKAIRL